MDLILGLPPDFTRSALIIIDFLCRITELLILSTIVLILCFEYRTFSPEVHIRDYETDTVYIFVGPHHPNTLITFPQSTQIEIFCLLHKINYQIVNDAVETERFQKYPFIELNGYQTKGFVNIEKRLEKHFKLQTTHDQKDEIDAMTKATDTQFNDLIRNYRDLRSCEDAPMKSSEIRETFWMSETQIAVNQQLRNLLSDIQNQDDEELCTFLQLVQDLIKGQQFMFGDKITTADIAVYSQITSVHFICPKSTVSTFVRQKYPSILEYLKRMQKEVNLLKKNK